MSDYKVQISDKAVVLLSGGMDSTTLAAFAKQRHKEVHALNIYYGQRHDVEIKCAEDVFEALGLKYYVTRNIDGVFQNSSLLKNGPDIDDNQTKNTVGATFVPARNSVFLSIAAGYADSIGANVVYYGAHAEDHSGYPDCRPEFLRAISEALRLGTANQVTISAPFITHHKRDIVDAAVHLNAPIHLTHSCYKGQQPACGTCPTCTIRIEAFREAGYIDPIKYAIDIDWLNAKPFPQVK